MNKTAKIIVIALAAIVLAGAVTFAILYVNYNTISFDYVSRQSHTGNSYLNIPVFGNKLALSEGGNFSAPFDLGMKNLDVYDAVNSPIYAYAIFMAGKYKDGVQLNDYEVNNDGGKTLTVTLKGSANNGGETVKIEKVFIFDIENASLDNLPAWTNRTEEDKEFYPM